MNRHLGEKCGLANRGITDSATLRKIAEKASARGIGVSTFGTGTEFNERLLADMAAAGGGRYAYVKSPEQIPMAFKDELRGLLQVVAQNVVIEVVVTGARSARFTGSCWSSPPCLTSSTPAICWRGSAASS